jgi:WXG100 family type VII secretion target
MGDNGGMKVEFGTLDAGAADIKNGASGIEAKLAEMERDLKPLQADWTGSASQAYLEAKQKWSSALTDMKTLLHEIGNSVGTSNEDYRDGENRNKNRW